MKTWCFNALEETDTDRFGAALAAALPPRAVVALVGTLGSGKTRLVQAVASADGVQRDSVTSPTFVLCQPYHAQHTIYHLDAYRIRDEDEWSELGVDELFTEQAWVFIEWADRFAELLPEERLTIEIHITGDRARKFVLTAHGDEMDVTVDQLGNRRDLKRT